MGGSDRLGLCEYGIQCFFAEHGVGVDRVGANHIGLCALYDGTVQPESARLLNITVMPLHGVCLQVKPDL